MPGQVISIIAVAQTPPPIHGQSIMSQLLLEGTYSKIRLHHVRMAFSNDIQEVGVFRWKKIIHLIEIFFQIIRLRFQTGASILYYPPASPNKVPFLRDCVLLIGTRWLFKKTVFHFHANGLCDFYPTLPVIFKRLFQWAYNCPSLSIAISKHGVRDGEFLKSKKTIVIPNGIPDACAFSKVSIDKPDKKPVILFCGMVSREKGVGILLKACVGLRDRGIPFYCRIAGHASSSAEQKSFEDFVQLHQLHNEVEFTGPLHGVDKWTAFAKADVFCFPTFYSAESFGLVAVEAMMCGLPVIATNWRGLPDIVVDGETGYLVPPQDPEATADRLQLLFENLSLRKRMGEAGRKRYEEHFTIDKFRHRMEEALSSLA